MFSSILDRLRYVHMLIRYHRTCITTQLHVCQRLKIVTGKPFSVHIIVRLETPARISIRFLRIPITVHGKVAINAQNYANRRAVKSIHYSDDKTAPCWVPVTPVTRGLNRTLALTSPLKTPQTRDYVKYGLH